MSKKKRYLLALARERGCNCIDEYYWFQMRDGLVGCNKCIKIIVYGDEYKQD